MGLGISVDLGGGGLQDAGFGPARESQHVHHADRGTLDRLDGVELIVDRRGGAGKIVDLVHLHKERVHDIVPQKLEVWVLQQVSHIPAVAREEVVQADDLIPARDQSLTEMAAEESGPTSYKNGFHDATRLLNTIHANGTP